MKIEVTKSMFRDAFRQANRIDNFSYDALGALFDYLEELDLDMAEELELDVITICCEYTEYDDIAEYNDDYGTEYNDYNEIDETAVIRIDGMAFIVQDH